MCLVPDVSGLLGMNFTGALIVVPEPTNWDVNIATAHLLSYTEHLCRVALQSKSFQVTLRLRADLQEVVTYFSIFEINYIK